MDCNRRYLNKVFGQMGKLDSALTTTKTKCHETFPVTNEAYDLPQHKCRFGKTVNWTSINRVRIVHACCIAQQTDDALYWFFFSSLSLERTCSSSKYFQITERDRMEISDDGKFLVAHSWISSIATAIAFDEIQNLVRIQIFASCGAQWAERKDAPYICFAIRYVLSVIARAPICF